ncbi:cellulase N-terminal Ig-like domain-containing protein [Nibricoccus sp. IMCC34717]|uniref:cellulase N-terminal Ig-like domain-containing protein n=1 Tax=Nibricoccus sp. IMCC34717 TaxID=3034021 RepID=UPI00384C3753
MNAAFLPPTPVPAGLLVSQIGYDLAGAKRALVRGPAGWLDARATAMLTDGEGREVWRGEFTPWGECWGSQWWVADFSSVAAAGDFQLEVRDERGLRHEAVVSVAAEALFTATWWHVSVDQAERRQWLVSDRLGWYDAGCHWQEANSHAAYLFGLADLYQICGYEMTEERRARLLAQVINGAGYLVRLQDLAQAKGLGDGAFVHQHFKFDELVLPADAAKACAALARVAAVLPADKAAEAATYRDRARRGLAWLRNPQPVPRLHFNHRPYGLPAGTAPGSGLATPELAMVTWAEALLAAAGDETQLDAAVASARALVARQVSEAQAEDGLHGHFRLFADGTVTVKAWAHGMTSGDPALPTDIGSTFGLNVLPLVTLVDSFPSHAEAPVWREALRRFAYGYFLPACRANPFLLAPNGHFPGQGLVWFAGLWHGANSLYGLAALHALHFARLFEDPAFSGVATGNLQWIAGLNAGLTAEAQKSAVLTSQDVPPGTAVPVSMINGIGRRCAGSWLNIRGAICNGFSTGDQFVWDVPPERAYDGPFRFTEEDWITHAGAWLSAIAMGRAEKRG